MERARSRNVSQWHALVQFDAFFTARKSACCKVCDNGLKLFFATQTFPAWTGARAGGKVTGSSAIAKGPRDASCQLKSCQLPRNSAETTYTTSPDQIDGMKLEI